jgi:Ca-activated chloride channel family protein
VLENLHLLHPEWLWALLPLALLILILGRGASEAGDWGKVVDPHLLPHLLVGAARRTQRWPLLLLGTGWVLAVIALANPVFEKQPRPLFRSQAARVIVLDLSRSMHTPDLKPSRMIRARFEVADILARSREGQTGLVVFAGDAFVISPLTDDTATIQALLGTLEPDLMPVQGSRADLGLLKAGELLQQAGSLRGDILLIADAADQRALAAAGRLHEQGYRVSAMAVGTEEGAPLPDGRGGFLRDREGNIVTPRLQPGLFKNLARAGGGRFTPLLGSDADLDRLLLDAVPGLEAESEAAELDTDLWKENGPWLALLLLPLGALAFRRGWLLGLAFVMAGNLYAPDPALAFGWEDLWQRRDQQAAEALTRGDHGLALQKARNPDRLGTAHFRAGDFDKAVDAFAQASSPDGHYNRGNSLARLGLLQEAVTAYDQALAQAPGMEDALYNKQQVEELLQRQAQSRQEQQDQTPSDAQNQEGEQGQDQQQRGQQAQGEDPQQPLEKDQQGEERESGQTQAPDSRASQPQPAGARTDDGQAPRPEGPANAGQQTQEHQAPARADDQAAATANAGKDDPEQARRELAKAMQQTGDANAEETPEQADTGHPSASEDHLDSEERQVMEQWLRRIPDDPGGLLRRKFLYQYARRAAGRNTGSADPW